MLEKIVLKGDGRRALYMLFGIETELQEALAIIDELVFGYFTEERLRQYYPNIHDFEAREGRINYEGKGTKRDRVYTIFGIPDKSIQIDDKPAVLPLGFVNIEPDKSPRYFMRACNFNMGSTDISTGRFEINHDLTRKVVRSFFEYYNPR